MWEMGLVGMKQKSAAKFKPTLLKTHGLPPGFFEPLGCFWKCAHIDCYHQNETSFSVGVRHFTKLWQGWDVNSVKCEMHKLKWKWSHRRSSVAGIFMLSPLLVWSCAVKLPAGFKFPNWGTWLPLVHTKHVWTRLIKSLECLFLHLCFLGMWE